MANVAYKTKAKVNIRRGADNAAEVVTSVDKGTTLQISDTVNEWAILSSDHNKINGKKVAGMYVPLSKIEKSGTSSSSTKSSSDKNSSHVDHITKSVKGKVVVNAYTRTSCSDTKASGVYIPKGSKVTVKKMCSANKMYLIEKGITLSNGKKMTKDSWTNMSAIEMSDSALDKIANAAAKAKEGAEKVSARLKALNEANSAKAASEAIQQLEFIDGMGAINTSTYAENLLVKNAQGIHGMPYQFMPSVDMRLSNKVSFGRKYVDRIVSRMPLVLFTPGKPDFLPSFTKGDRNTIIQELVSKSAGLEAAEGQLDKLLKKAGRYYTFRFDYANYYKYVNQMLRYCAIVLGIGDVKHGNMGYNKTWNQAGWGMATKAGYEAKLKNFRWEKAVNSKLKGFVNAKEYVAFYVDSDSSISESIDNSTASSSLASTVSEATALSREIQFLAGPFAGVRIADLTENNEAFQKSKAKVKQIADKYMGGGRLYNNIGELFSSVAKGGKILFPELWDDSTFTKNYSINLKLRTPDMDVISWYLNICVPLMHILSLAAPHYMSPNGYSAPFLVRAYYKGIFNCDMGIITGLDISKGKEGAWTLDGLPSEVDVSITLKDLYGAFSISKDANWKFFTNTALIDYLCNTCGVNINKMETARLVEAYTTWKQNQFKDIFPDMWLGLEQGASNLVGKAYTKIFKKGS